MSGPELKRCFECGATYPVDAIACPSDQTPLCFDTVGRRWKVQSLIGLRPGGAVFEATHLIHGTRAAIDLLPGSNAREVDFEARMQKQLQALRLLDKHKNILPLIEDGTERDGSRFYVTELLTGRRLSDVLAAARKQQPAGDATAAGPALLDPSFAAQLVRPLAALLSTTHRIGVGHGAIDATQVYLQGEGKPPASLNEVSAVRLHGLMAIGMGPVLREAVAADLRALCVLVAELVTGRPPSTEVEVLRREIPAAISGPVGSLVLRGLGAGEAAPFASADELQRALAAAASVGASLEPESGPEPTPRPLSAPSLPSLPPEFRASAPGRSLPSVRVTSQHAALPLTPVVQGPVRSGLTGELRQVSILDLMREREQSGLPGGFTDVVEVNTPAAPVPPKLDDEDDESSPSIQVESAPSSAPPVEEPASAAPATGAPTPGPSPAPSSNTPAFVPNLTAPAPAPVAPSGRSGRDVAPPSAISARSPSPPPSARPPSEPPAPSPVAAASAHSPARPVEPPVAAPAPEPAVTPAAAPPVPVAPSALSLPVGGKDLPRWVWVVILAAVGLLAIGAGLLSP